MLNTDPSLPVLAKHIGFQHAVIFAYQGHQAIAYVDIAPARPAVGDRPAIPTIIERWILGVYDPSARMKLNPRPVLFPDATLGELVLLAVDEQGLAKLDDYRASLERMSNEDLAKETKRAILASTLNWNILRPLLDAQYEACCDACAKRSETFCREVWESMSMELDPRDSDTGAYGKAC
jgi:hypothetical protein